MTAEASTDSTFEPLAFIGQQAAELHRLDSEGLAITIDASELEPLLGSLPSDIKVEEQQLKFESIAIRNRFAAEHHFEINKKVIGLAVHPAWMSVCQEIWEHDDKSSAESVAGRLLAMLNHHFDIFHLASTTMTEGNVFDVLIPIAASLPFLDDFSIEHLYSLCTVQDDLTRRDYFRGYFFQKLSLTLVNRSDVARDIIVRQRQDISETTASLYMAASTAIATAEPEECASYVLDDTQSENRILKSAAIQMIGNLIYAERVGRETNERFAEIIRLGLKSTDELIRDSSLRAIASSAARTIEFDSDLTSLISDGDRGSASALAQILWKHWKDSLRKGLAENSVPIICRIFSTSELDCTFLDSLLSSMLLEPEHHTLVLNGLQEWILAPPPKSLRRDLLENLGGTASRLLGNSQLLSLLVTSWLIHDGLGMPLAVENILRHAFHIDHARDLKLTFDLERVVSLDFATFELLAYRTLAFVTRAENQVSLIVSLLKSPNLTSQQCAVLQQILINDLGYDYPGLVIVALENASRNSTTSKSQELCTQVTSELNRINELRRNLPYRKEVQPPSSVVRSFEKKRTTEINSALKQSESQSVLLNLVTKIPVKAGRQIFNFQHVPLDRAMTMNEFEVAYTVPRRMILDPVGLEYRRRLYMCLRKDPQ